MGLGARERAYPGGVLVIGGPGRPLHVRSVGHVTYEVGAPPATGDTLYDLASVTKVVGTTSAIMVLVDEGRLALDQRVAQLLPGFVGPGKPSVTVEQLLRHESGLPGWAPLYMSAAGKDLVGRVAAADLAFVPGGQTVYSDLGMILAGEIVQGVADEPLDQFLRRRVFEPLGMPDTMYSPSVAMRGRTAPTEECSWRGRLVWGAVQDENAHALGGVAGHAGLFSTASDMSRFAMWILTGKTATGARIVSPQTMTQFVRQPVRGRRLGWDGPGPDSGLPPRSFGHTGLTGTVVWLDPDSLSFVVLLTNRIHPTRTNDRFSTIRDAILKAAFEDLKES